jgi:DNA polymerase III delta subunit
MTVTLIGGEDTFASQKKINVIKSEFRKQNSNSEIVVMSADDINNFKDLAILNGEIGLFSTERMFILKNLINSGRKSLKDDFAEYLKENQDKNNLKIVIYETSKFDKRSKIYKFFKKKGELIEYPEAKEKDKKKFVKNWFKKNQISINSSALDILIKKLIPLNKLMIANELEKLRLLLKEDERKIIELEDLNLINQDIEEEIWELFKLAIDNKEDALRLLENLFNQRIHFTVIIGYLSSQLRQVIDYKYDQTSLSPFLRKKAGIIARKVDSKKLNLFVDRLVKLDISLKSSRINPKLALTAYVSAI